MPIECNVDVTQNGDVNGPIIVGLLVVTVTHLSPHQVVPPSCSPACILPQTPGCIVSVCPLLIHSSRRPTYISGLIPHISQMGTATFPIV